MTLRSSLKSLITQRQSASNRAAVESTIAALAVGDLPGVRADELNGRWKLEWSSQTADVNPFATPDSVLGGVCFQEFDLSGDGRGRLANIVEWAPQWRLVGGAAVAPSGSAVRCILSVDTAIFELGGVSLDFSVSRLAKLIDRTKRERSEAEGTGANADDLVGRGWLECVYLEDGLRVSRDNTGFLYVHSLVGPVGDEAVADEAVAGEAVAGEAAASPAGPQRADAIRLCADGSAPPQSTAHRRRRAALPRMAAEDRADRADAAAAAAEVRISRVSADANPLFPTNARRLSRFLMEATYGQCRPLSPAWVQRGVLDSVGTSDLFSRLAYFEEGRATGRARGDLLMAQTASGEICGFADLSASLWLPKDRAFRLPAESDELQRLASTGRGADGQPRQGVELRPYVSNLVVGASRRRSGVGRRLMAACEEEAARWDCAGAGLWLEVTATNAAALRFYRSLGYVEEGCTAGNEVVRDGDGGFRMAEVERCILRKALC